MTDSPPPSPLITPDTRRRLQQRYEEAARLIGQRPCDHARVHDLLAECLRADPGNILYLNELLANLRRWNPKAARSWLPNWLRSATGSGVFRGPKSYDLSSTQPAKDSRPPDELLRAAPDLLRVGYDDPKLLGQLASAAGEYHFDETELIYWWSAVEVASDPESLRGLARCLTRCGRFPEALENWRKLAARAPDDESTRAIDDLARPPDGAEPGVAADYVASDVPDVSSAIRAAENLQKRGEFAEADQLLRRVLSAAGGELRVHEALESLQMARSVHQIEIARRRAAHDEHPKAQALAGRLEQEHNRLEIDIFHVRSERHPDDLALRLELARRLKRAGNYSGAIQRLEESRSLKETRADKRIAGEVLLELGECWQHLRQFGKALDFFRQAAVVLELEGKAAPRPLVGALYRIGVLTAAMNQPAEARAALVRLLEVEPGYKDARQRLDNLP